MIPSQKKKKKSQKNVENCSCSLRFLAACKDHRKALEVSQHSEEMGLILGVCAGGLVVLILLLGAVIVIIKKG